MIYFVPLQDMNFQLVSKYKPTGDQPEAIRQLTDGVLRGDAARCCWVLLARARPSPWPMS